MEQQELIDKIKRLPQNHLAEVGDFVDSLSQREDRVGETLLHQVLADYAIQHSGSTADLDSDLEAVSSEHLFQKHSEQ